MAKHSFKRLLVDLNWCFYSGVGAVLIFTCLSLTSVDHFVIELFRNFPLQYFVIGVVSLFWSVLTANKRGIFLSILVIGLNYVQIKDYPLTFLNCCESAPEASLRVMSVNVFTSNSRKQELLDNIKKHSPDVVSFLEVNNSWVQVIDNELGVDYRHYLEFPRSDNFGIALRSKFPILKSRIEALGEGQPESIVADMLVGERVIRVVVTHPVPPMSSANNYLNNQQLKSITTLVLENNISTIIMGDLNSTPWGLEFKNLISGAKLKDPRVDFGILPTWPMDRFVKKLFSIPIDYILVSEDFKVLNLQVDLAPGSDHKMIIADLK